MKRIRFQNGYSTSSKALGLYFERQWSILNGVSIDKTNKYQTDKEIHYRDMSMYKRELKTVYRLMIFSVENKYGDNDVYYFNNETDLQKAIIRLEKLNYE